MFEFTHSNGIHIPHLSVSTINSFIENRTSFYQSKVNREPFKGNVYTIRGQAVEESINIWIEKGDVDVAKNALAVFDSKIADIGISKLEANEVRSTVEGLANLAFEVYSQEFAQTKAITQHKISVRLDGVEREIIGYLDFFQPEIRVRDSKVVSKTPSKLKQGYVLQGALYRKATGCNVVFDFFVANKKPAYKAIQITDDEYIFGINYLTLAAKAIEELESCGDPKRVMEICMAFPNLEGFWNYDEKLAAAEKLGIQLP